MLQDSARALLQSGVQPPGAIQADRYALRSGGWVAHKDKPLAQVMVERFGDVEGFAGPDRRIT